MTDVVDRDVIMYEEPTPGKIKLDKDGCLLVASRKALNLATPRPFVPNVVQVDTRPAPDTAACNHAGITIGPNEEPQGRAEKDCWVTSQREVEGYRWVGKRTLDEPYPPTLTVVNIRRQDGVMYAVVEGSDGFVRRDMPLQLLRQRRYDEELGRKYRALPLMLQWGLLRDSIFALDWPALAHNAEFYQNIVR